MTLIEQIQQFLNFLAPFWIETIIGLSFAGFASLLIRWWYIAKKRNEWKEKESRETVNFSVTTTVTDETGVERLEILSVGTELKLSEFIINDVGAESLVQKTKQTTNDQMYILSDNDSDQRAFLKAAVSQIGAAYKEGAIKKTAGVPCRMISYKLGIMFEQYENLLERKIRVHLVSEDLLRKIKENEKWWLETVKTWPGQEHQEDRKYSVLKMVNAKDDDPRFAKVRIYIEDDLFDD